VENIKLRPNKGVKGGVLEGLGQFNVICGKNNGGKSTVLECIFSIDKRFVGKQIPPTSIHSIWKAFAASAGWNTVSENEVPAKKLINVLSGVLSYEPSRVWYQDNSQEFEKRVADGMNTPAEGQYGFASLSIERPFLELILDKRQSIFLPPRRLLDQLPNASGTQPLQALGYGLINYLFNAKNSPSSNPQNAIWQRIRDAFRSISEGCEFEIFMKAGALDLCFAVPEGDWIPAEACGLGLQDLLIILSHGIIPDFGIVCVEEPESHIHPDMQRRLALYLRSLTQKQFFVSTHSNIFLDSTIADKVFYVYYRHEVIVQDATSRAIVLSALGYQVSDNLVSDLIILIEGPTDRPALEALLSKWDFSNKYDIRFWPLGGDIMDQLDLGVFAQSNAIIAVIDKDPKSRSVRNRFVKNCRKQGIFVHRLKRYAIENYVSLRAYREVYGSQIPSALSRIDPDTKVEIQIGFSPKKKLGPLMQETSRAEIEATDLKTFMDVVEKAASTAKRNELEA
jgi:energy-coupling factor transporter ATP-binding protein EcfA2